MRGEDTDSGQLFSYIDIEARIPKDHPLRLIRDVLNETLASMDGKFASLYSGMGRPSIAPERLIRALILQALYSVRSERQLMEQLEYNFLFRWFVGLSPDEPVWNASTFSKNRDRLLSHDIAPRLLVQLLSLPRIQPLLSEAHFSVDGTLIDAWASMKSFVPIEADDDANGGGHSDGGRNRDVNFKGQKRKNDTHRSTTDPDCRLYKKSAGQSSRLCYMGHVIMENRSGLAVSTALTPANGTAEQQAALNMLTRTRHTNRATLGADKAYDVWRFKKTLRKDHHIISHAAKKRTEGRGGLPVRFPKGYDASQKARKRIEEIFGWIKTIGGQSKTMFRGLDRVGLDYNLSVIAYNLVRLPKLLAA